MKRTYFYALFLLLGFIACKNESTKTDKVAEEELAPMNSEEFMNAYVDSINLVADSLQSVYHTLLNAAASNLDSAKGLIPTYTPVVNNLKSQLNGLNEDITILIEKKWITEGDYQIMFHEIHLGDAEKSEQTLEILGMSFTSTAETGNSGE